MRVALGLITCERFDYTKRTLESFFRYNDPSQFVLLHGDDASEDKRIIPLANSFGFSTLYHNHRLGVMATQRRVANTALMADCDWCVILQNDQESVRPFPWDLLEWVQGDPNVYCLRLYGELKSRGGTWERRAGSRHKGKGHMDAGWRPYEDAPEPAEIGSIHWSSQPAATKADLLVWLLNESERESDCREKSGEIDLMTVRPVANVTWHIGEERTPDFKR